VPVRAILRLGSKVRLPLGLVVVTLWLSLVAPLASRAADPLAPPGAPPTWLPNVPWVQERWLPYRESDLFRVLNINVYTLGAWLTDHRGLADLVRAKHLDLRRVETELMAPWRGKVSGRQYRVLFRRTDLTFTQDHLAGHMFFHTFHLASVNGALPALLRVNFPEMGQLQSAGLTLMDIAIRNGRTRAEVLARLLQAIHASDMEGVREHAVLPDQEKLWFAYQQANLAAWLTWRPPGSHLTASGTSFSAAVAQDASTGSSSAAASGEYHFFCKL
jgi:hypothetical protein